MNTLCRTAAAVLLCLGLKVASKEHIVKPGGDTIQSVLDDVKPGDVITIESGDYFENLTTKTSGTKDARITIKGANGKDGRESVVLRGADDPSGTGRVFELNHEYYTLEDFTIDGQVHDNSEDVDEDNAEEYYRNILLYVISDEKPTERSGGYMSALDGLIIRGMVFKHALGECVRIRNFVTYADIDNNEIMDCGILDYVINPGNDENKNGEGIYLGTARAQWDDDKNPTREADVCLGNRIRNNYIVTNGNEGIDVKEGCLGTIVDNNIISMQHDENAGGISSHADDTTITHNTITDASGAGVRVGSNPDEDDIFYGLRNTVTGNMFVNCASGVDIVSMPQREICGNDVELPPDQSPDTYKYSEGRHGDDFEPFMGCDGTAAPSPTPNTPVNLPREIIVEPGGRTIQSALDEVGPGDVVIIESGDYFEDVQTKVSGTEDARITIKGAGGRSGRESVVLRGAGVSYRVFQLMHDYYTFEDFTIDGQDEDNALESSRGTLLYVYADRLPTERRGGYMSALDGLVVSGMVFKHALGECVRLRNFVTHAVIADNVISDCGLLDFEIDGDTYSKNGEGIYLGTVRGQWDFDKSPSPEGDVCLGNVIRNNYIMTNGNEGVDVKEGCLDTIIANNEISVQLDPSAAGISSRADNTTITGNTITDTAGAGVRVGKRDPDENGIFYGLGNTVTDNTLVNCASGVKIMAESQGEICGNAVELPPGQDEDTYEYSTGTHGEDFEPFEACIVTGTPSPTPSTPAPTSAPSTPAPSPGPSAVSGSLIPGAVYLGCFVDKLDERTMLPGYKAKNTLTNEDCIEHCKNDGKRFAGTTIGRMCRCTNYETNVSWHGESTSCNMECPQDSAMPCGGDWAVTSWEILPGSSWETSTEWR